MRTPKQRKFRVAGINFEHSHMIHLLKLVHDHPGAEIVGVCDEQRGRMQEAIGNFGIPKERVFQDHRDCLQKTKPDLVVLCPATARHAHWVKMVAPFRTHVMLEKPFASTLVQADQMIAAMEATGKQLIINWPLRWVPSHITAKRLVDEGRIGRVLEVHYHGGNRGPVWHSIGKSSGKPTMARKASSWFYRKSAGGGSLLDYLGYGTTLGTWFLDGRAPLEVTAVLNQPKGLEVDEHSIVVARYDTGLSKFETRWGTFTDPWIHQPQPKCGFVLVGTKGTISSYDYEPTVRIQTEAKPEGFDLPADTPKGCDSDPISHVIECLSKGKKIRGPLSPAVSRIGQQIVDSAVRSARLKKTVKLSP